MVDWIALLVSHGLIALMFWRLLWRAELDEEKAPGRRHRPTGFGARDGAPDEPGFDGRERRSNDPAPRTGWRGDA